ncbi:uncharacterized [Tachysurus ichikawai]
MSLFKHVDKSFLIVPLRIIGAVLTQSCAISLVPSQHVRSRKSCCACAYLLGTEDIEDCHIIDHQHSDSSQTAGQYPSRKTHGSNSLQLVPLGWYTPTVL